MTNRKDMIDDALLRPGRLELKIEVGLPEEKGRYQILKIHTKSMRESNRMQDDVDLVSLAKNTRNWTGAELAGLVRNAGSYACSRQLDTTDPAKPLKREDVKNVTVNKSDFDKAFIQTEPAFGVSADVLNDNVRNGLVDYGEDFSAIRKECKILIDQAMYSDFTRLVSILLVGPRGCGKTAFASTLALDSSFPFVKFLSAQDLVESSVEYVRREINTIFANAYKSAKSFIVIDDIERLLNYAAIGPMFSNNILQTLLTRVQQEPRTAGHKMVVIGTTSNLQLLQRLELTQSFHFVLNIPSVKGKEIATVLREIGTLGDKTDDETASSDSNEAEPGFSSIVCSQIAQRFEEMNGEIPIKRLFIIGERALQAERRRRGMPKTDKGSLTEQFFSCLSRYS
eukprot:TRINITY_DN9515_c0_g2_i1.p1 TRINITY_DN9515_c0_g2~~TRINITY_DN9515_c0_g2_i1.p1  ORF type:complete len:448 (-),score=79.54 TRINITY_DN9515_c0_g2_i1:55-1245(-)